MDSHATLIEEIRMLREQNKGLAGALKNLLRAYAGELVEFGSYAESVEAATDAARAALAKDGAK